MTTYPWARTVRSRRGDYRVIETPAEHLGNGVSAIITDANVAPLLKAPSLPLWTVPAGERSKSLEHLGELLNFLAEAGISRNDKIAAVGGGVVGDLAGFAAAIYHRGIAWINVPTSLLAMVDSSIGGKVAIDLPAGKNLAGAFHPPEEVRLHLPFLSSLPATERACGMAEVLKVAAILDRSLFDHLADDHEMITRAIEIKASVVEADEEERSGHRALLNFGHTIGHALEVVTDYAHFRHGEAVSIGMVAEAQLGARLGITDPGVAPFLRAQLEAAHLPTNLPRSLDAEALVTAMRRDKKASEGRLAFALVTELGAGRLFPNVPEGAVRAIIAEG